MEKTNFNCPVCEECLNVIITSNRRVTAVQRAQDVSDDKVGAVISCTKCRASLVVTTELHRVYPELSDDLTWESLQGIYLRGFMAKDDGDVFLFVKSGDKDTTLLAHSERDYADGPWELSELDYNIERDDKYKAIGDTIRRVEVTDQQGCREWIRLVTPAKIIAFGMDYSDNYYPYSLWEEQ